MAELTSDVLRGYNDTIILSLLRDADSYGYQLSKKIREASDGRYAMKETTLYSAINRLERQGLLQSYGGEETLGKPRTYYRLTDAGAAHLREKRTEWELTKQILSVFIENEGAE